MRIAVFGLGYVGAVTAAGLAASGHDVIGVDVDDTKVGAINAGKSPVVEPGIVELIERSVSSGRLNATTYAADALRRADVSLICVGTPSGAHGETDLTYIRRVLADIRAAMPQVPPPASGHHSIVIRSTVPPGTGRDVVEPVFADPPAGWTIGTAMCPEFLREGVGVKDFFDPPFVVVGTASDPTAGALDEMFDFLGHRVHHVGVATAEALKYSCNAFHATKVSFANELARIFRGCGVDTREVMEIFVLDRKLNIAPTYLRPGFAFGGSCLPKDLRSLQHMARMHGVDAPLLAGTSLTNELVVRDVVERVIETGERTVALLGLSFKADTDDLRESPYVEVAERLLGKGFDVRIYDPIINPDRLVGSNRLHVESRLPHLNRILACSAEEALAGAGVALVSSSDVAVTAALAAMSPRTVIDLNGHLGNGIEELAGYSGVGW